MPIIQGAPASIEKAVAAVAEARARWETVNKADCVTKVEVLSKNEFYEEETGKRIISPKTDFLMSEDDFTRYCTLVYTSNLKKGLDSGGVGLTFWPIQKAAYDAEDRLIEAVAAELPEYYSAAAVEQIKRDHKFRKEFLKIVGFEHPSLNA